MVLNRQEKRDSRLEDGLIEVTSSEEKTETRMQENEHRELWGTTEMATYHRRRTRKSTEVEREGGK